MIGEYAVFNIFAGIQAVQGCGQLAMGGKVPMKIDLAAWTAISVFGPAQCLTCIIGSTLRIVSGVVVSSPVRNFLFGVGVVRLVLSALVVVGPHRSKTSPVLSLRPLSTPC
jgi:hypothetical protein